MTPCSKLCLNVNLIQSYRRPPLLRNAFLEKTDIKFNYGDSLGTEVLAQEDGILNTRRKRKGDLRKLEYCTKVILTALYMSLLSSAKARIIDIKTYCLQSNGFQLTISASKYLFEKHNYNDGLTKYQGTEDSGSFLKTHNSHKSHFIVESKDKEEYRCFL
ncbi:17937_t:CDS:2 [Rhizophagus irregularis]|nr:17937_t:CDS:2 [Rhizophagus irregularis]